MTSDQLTARFIQLYIVFFVKHKERINLHLQATL